MSKSVSIGLDIMHSVTSIWNINLLNGHFCPQQYTNQNLVIA